MGEIMEFPKTIEEFIEKYSFKDEKQIYTNGSVLLPVFRVKQMIDHYFSKPKIVSNSIRSDTDELHTEK